MRRFADCFTDRRDPRYVEHQVETLVGQRIFGLALGYEDLNDHDELRLRCCGAGETLCRTETPDAIIDHYPPNCAGCGGPLTEASLPSRT